MSIETLFFINDMPKISFRYLQQFKNCNKIKKRMHQIAHRVTLGGVEYASPTFKGSIFTKEMPQDDAQLF